MDGAVNKKIERRSRQRPDLNEKGVKRFFFSEEQKLPLVFRAEYAGLDLRIWLSENAALIKRELDASGAVLFRGFANTSIEEFNQVVRAWNPELMDYDFGSTPRTNLQAGIYTSTEYPADQEIVMHNEMAYTGKYPAYLWFYCHQPAESGGQTPLADSREMYKMLGQEITQLFESRKIVYCRNYKPGIDVPWTSVFRTTDKQAVEAFCADHNIDFEWVNDEHLRTREACPGVITHPETREKVWFNQAHLFHISNLSEELAGQLAMIPEADLPRNVYWDNGEPMDTAILDKIRSTFRQAKVKFDWQAGDMLLVDNLLASHGREPYSGSRKILVAMQGALTAEPI
ncbi:MAG TPA: TauD/TfdA family dioxygenase [Flavilitoribacter sp.]|nr:TauD/TfdA family dioxygenase [Flavilitoribacter sp.]HMQ88749.1 TauD/TfdA family dioxygenase [Flavilitoribacter sp.]